MNFNIYDILAKVIPGSILTIILWGTGYFTMEVKLPDVAFLIGAYFLGYLIDAIGYWLQYHDLLFNWLFGGKPTDIILSGGNIEGQSYKPLEKLKEKYGQKKWEEDEVGFIWSTLYRKSMDGPRVQTYGEQWFSARNILISYIIGYPFMLFKLIEIGGGSSMGFCIIILASGVIPLLSFRTKARQFLFIKEVLDTYLHSKEKDIQAPA